jgi:hypothetical protein
VLTEFIEEYYPIARLPHQGLERATPFSARQSDPMAETTRLVFIPIVSGFHCRCVPVAY